MHFQLRLMPKYAGGYLLCAYFFLVTISHAAESVHEQSPKQILLQIDRQRLPDGAFEAEIIITPAKDGTDLDSGNYTVRSNGEGNVLVEARNPDQRGQKFLTTESGIFFFAPRTKRAIRITPLQALRGQASIGDVSRLRFATDYEASKPGNLQGVCKGMLNCAVLELKSKTEAATYARIELTTKQFGENWQPVSASLFLVSGKLAKTLVFGRAESGLPPSTRYIDAINVRLETSVVFRSIKAAKFPPNLFNPRALEQ